MNYSYGGGYGGCDCPECQKDMTKSEFAHQVILLPFAREMMGEKVEDAPESGKDSEEAAEEEGSGEAEEEPQDMAGKMQELEAAIKSKDASKAKEMVDALIEAANKSPGYGE